MFVKATAQVAVEAIINNPSAYDAETIAEVRTTAIAAGVAPFYVDLLPAAEVV